MWVPLFPKQNAGNNTVALMRMIPGVPIRNSKIWLDRQMSTRISVSACAMLIQGVPTAIYSNNVKDSRYSSLVLIFRRVVNV